MGDRTMKNLTLDELYWMTSRIYSEQNIVRSPSSTFSHFAEVCGMLSIHARNKKREGFDVTDALCKALGWYFPLLAKFRVKSVENLVFRKFPYVCPYCRRLPHSDAHCKLVKGTGPTVNHEELNAAFVKNKGDMPSDLNNWQMMFHDIYPREIDDRNRSVIGLFEELGELAEAIRVFDRYPKYFMGEAADVFSYLMGIANEHSLRLSQEQNIEFSFQTEFLRRYPGLCPQCGSKVCCCPAIPTATVGRMAKELDIATDEDLFVQDVQFLDDMGDEVSHKVVESHGGYSGIINSLPFDRGDTNRAIVQICISLAQSLEKSAPDIAERLMAAAVNFGNSSIGSGLPAQNVPAEPMLTDIRKALHLVDEAKRDELFEEGKLVGELAEALTTKRLLFCICGPDNEEALSLGREMRTISQCIDAAKHRNRLIYDTRPAATPDDLRRALLNGTYEIVHFSGHADGQFLVFEDERGNAHDIEIGNLIDTLEKHSNLECVVLNACSTLDNNIGSKKFHIIGYRDSIPDAAAIEFSKGFYDALLAGQSIQQAIDEGKSAMTLAGHGTDDLVIRSP